MADTLSKAERSERMSRVRGANTKPEMRVRQFVHRLGYRYRLHRSDLPGRPDMVFPSRRKVIFVHGCFWHQHDDPACRLARKPKSRLEFWLPKLEGNRKRDQLNAAKLGQMGWKVLVLWECALSSDQQLKETIVNFLEEQL